MSCAVVDLTSRLTHRPSLAQQARERVAKELLRTESPLTLIMQAQARAESNVERGLSIDEAVRRVIAWAHEQLPPTPPAAA